MSQTEPGGSPGQRDRSLPTAPGTRQGERRAAVAAGRDGETGGCPASARRYGRIRAEAGAKAATLAANRVAGRRLGGIAGTRGLGAHLVLLASRPGSRAGDTAKPQNRRRP